MKLINNKSTNVDALLRNFSRNLELSPRFKLPVAPDVAGALLMAAYRHIVACRGRMMIDTNVVFNGVQKIADALAQDCPRSGVLLMGNIGAGKTTALYALQKVFNYLDRLSYYDYIKRDFYREQWGMKVVDAVDLPELAKNESEFRHICGYALLGIDDLGCEPAEVQDYGNIIYPAQRLIEYRYKRGLFTFITTNLDMEAIADKYDIRIADRLSEMCSQIIFANDSFRK